MHVLLCRPNQFDVPTADGQNNYMNPDDKPDRNRAIAQHAALELLYRKLGIEISFIPARESLVDMCFTANCAITHPNPEVKKVLLSNFKPCRRQAERELYDRFFREQGYTVFIVASHLFFEGAGDVLFYRDIILGGYGFRTESGALSQVAQFTEREMISLRLQNPGKHRKNPYHLDTAILPLPDARTIIVYKEAFSPESLAKLEKIANVIPASVEDAENMALNALVVPRHELRLSPSFANSHPAEATLLAQKRTLPHGAVIMSDKASDALKETIMKAGYVPITVDVSEFLKSGAGVFCLTKIL